MHRDTLIYLKDLFHISKTWLILTLLDLPDVLVGVCEEKHALA